MANKKISEFALVNAAGQNRANTFFGGYDPTRTLGDRNIRMNSNELAKLLGAGIGNTVVGGTPNRVLYVDGSGNLADSANLTFSGTQLGLAQGTAAAPSLKFGTPQTGLYASSGTNIERLHVSVAGSEAVRFFRDTATGTNELVSASSPSARVLTTTEVWSWGMSTPARSCWRTAASTHAETNSSLSDSPRVRAASRRALSGVA